MRFFIFTGLALAYLRGTVAKGEDDFVDCGEADVECEGGWSDGGVAEEESGGEEESTSVEDESTEPYDEDSWANQRVVISKQLRSFLEKFALDGITMREQLESSYFLPSVQDILRNEAALNDWHDLSLAAAVRVSRWDVGADFEPPSLPGSMFPDPVGEEYNSAKHETIEFQVFNDVVQSHVDVQVAFWIDGCDMWQEAEVGDDETADQDSWANQRVVLAGKLKNLLDMSIGGTAMRNILEGPLFLGVVEGILNRGAIENGWHNLDLRAAVRVTFWQGGEHHMFCLPGSLFPIIVGEDYDSEKHALLEIDAWNENFGKNVNVQIAFWKAPMGAN